MTAVARKLGKADIELEESIQRIIRLARMRKKMMRTLRGKKNNEKKDAQRSNVA